MIKLAGTQATLGYFTKEMESHHGGMVLVDGHVYGASDPGILRCIELSTGKKKWENRSVGKGAITWVDGMLVLRSEGGPVALVACQPDKYEELGRFEPGIAAAARPGRTRSSPPASCSCAIKTK